MPTNYATPAPGASARARPRSSVWPRARPGGSRHGSWMRCRASAPARVC